VAAPVRWLTLSAEDQKLQKRFPDFPVSSRLFYLHAAMSATGGFQKSAGILSEFEGKGMISSLRRMKLTEVGTTT
jgi:hypothetical protein